MGRWRQQVPDYPYYPKAPRNLGAFEAQGASQRTVRSRTSSHKVCVSMTVWDRWQAACELAHLLLRQRLTFKKEREKGKKNPRQNIK